MKPTKTTAYEPNLYGDLEMSMMSKLDREASIALTNLLTCRPTSNISEETKRNWANFIVSQLTRSPEDIQQIKENTKHYVAKLISDIQNNPEKYKEKIKDGDLEEFLAYRDSHFSDSKLADRVMPTILGHDAISKDIFGMDWRVLDVGKEEFALLTSDQPVSLTYCGKSSDIEITMPLSPQHLLIAANSSEKLARILARGKQRLVRFSNLEVTRKAAKFVYAENDTMFDFVRRHISTGRTLSLNERVAKARGFPIIRKN